MSRVGQGNKLVDRWVLFCLLRLWVNTGVANLNCPLRSEALVVMVSIKIAVFWDGLVQFELLP
jgi:hypothetical protein